MSRRIRPLTNDIPKCLLPIPFLKSFIEYQISELEKHGVEFIIVVGGYKISALEKYIDSRNFSSDIRILFNPEYDTKNNCYSLYLAFKYLNEIGLLQSRNIILINSDVIFHPKIFEKIFKSDLKSHTLVIDDRKTLTPEDMKVKVEAGRIVKISKQLALEDAYGEYIGIAYFYHKDNLLLLESLEQVVNNQPNEYYEGAFQLLIDQYNYSFDMITTDGFFWTEVDTVEDYDRLNSVTEKFFKTM